MKKIKLFVTLCIIGTSLFCLNNSVSAKASALAVTASDGKVYEYQYNDLKVSASSYALNGANDVNSKLYVDFLSRKSSIKAFYDDIKNSYVDFSTIANAASSSAGSNTKFDFKSFLENSSTPTISLKTSKVTSDSSGKILVDEQLNDTGNVDLSSITVDTTVIPYSTVIIFKTNITNPNDYSITLKGEKCIYNSTKDRWAVTIDGTYAVSNFTQSDFVITKENNPVILGVDMSTLTIDSTSIPRATIIAFKLTVSNPSNYDVKVKGYDTIFYSGTGKFGITLDGTYVKSDLKLSDFVIIKKSN